MSKAELASMLRRFIGDEPGGGDWEWDDFTSVRADQDVEPYRQRLLREVDPHLGKTEKAEEIEAVVRDVIAELEASA